MKDGLKRALVHVCGLGQYELTANGRKVGNDYLSPGWSKYDRTCLYDTHDLTDLLRAGPNAVGIELASGMYNVVGNRYTKFHGTFGPLEAIAHLRLEYADGTVETVVTDDRWQAAPGPITFADIYGGEDLDARRIPHGWDRTGFTGSWARATVLEGPGGVLRGHSSAAPPLREIAVLKPVSVNQREAGVFVYDFGQNAPLVPRLRVRSQSGNIVRLTPAELLGKDGGIDRGSCGGGVAYWQYTVGQTGTETWFPKFWYHGCRYIEARVLAGPDSIPPVIKSLEGVVVHSSAPPVGTFECSSDLFNRIHTLVRWAQRSNLVSVITDCPHRERLGWLEQYHLNGPALRYEWDLARVFTKGCVDMADSQLPDGLVPDIAPEYVKFEGGFRDSPEWGSAFVLVPWQQYEWTGDVSLLHRNYEGMKRYVAYLGSKAKDHIVSHGLGDWYDIGPKPPGYAQLTPMALTATAFYYCDTEILAQAARLLGRADDEARYSAQASEIKAAFNRAFFHENPVGYATGSQCANALPLVFGLVPENRCAAVVEAIVADVKKRGNAITAGDVGYRYLLRALADGGRSDVIFAMNNQSEHPGYGYQLKMGATSLTEAWDAGRASSQNHFMLGQINEWFYHDVAGIAPDPAGPGYRRVLIRPQPVGDLTWVKASYDSVRGKISTWWTKNDGQFKLEVAIPPGCTATISIPAPGADAVTEGDKPAGQSPGVKRLRFENGTAVFEVGSGDYRFAVAP